MKKINKIKIEYQKYLPFVMNIRIYEFHKRLQIYPLTAGGHTRVISSKFPTNIRLYFEILLYIR